ncbi:MAG TPA: pyridoxal phosphate-dependent aminotransferase family protein, partial [Desulfobacteraceae bacterium]|nr:pyridoxal phosphate-dependent aminotransferase family protein [Desulfobacteraceae bacterium]
MSLTELDKALDQEIESLKDQGTAKPPERVIEGYLPPRGNRGPRYRLQGIDEPFIRMNSNAYLSLSTHPELIKAADQATGEFGVGPGAVRFIDGTFIHHTILEEKIARFVEKPAAKIFNSAYTANCGLALAIGSNYTHWIGDQLNHNSIIRAMRISNVKSHRKGIFRHNDMDDL